jgi:hypothetical protein
MKNILCFLIVISVLLVSCVVRGRITRIYISNFNYGKVIGKNYVPEYAHSVRRLNLNGTGYHNHITYYPEVYNLVIFTTDNFTRSSQTKEVSVSRSVFYSAEIGNSFVSGDGVSRYTLEIKDNKGNFGCRTFPYNKVKMFKVGDFVDFNALNN